MEQFITEITALAQTCDCGNHHNSISIERIVVGSGILEEAVTYVKEKSFRKVKLVADHLTIKLVYFGVPVPDGN